MSAQPITQVGAADSQQADQPSQQSTEVKPLDCFYRLTWLLCHNIIDWRVSWKTSHSLYNAKVWPIELSYFVQLLRMHEYWFVLYLLIMSFRLWLQATTTKFHKSFKASPCFYCGKKHPVLGLNGNSPRAITISTSCGNALAYIILASLSALHAGL